MNDELELVSLMNEIDVAPEIATHVLELGSRANSVRVPGKSGIMSDASIFWHRKFLKVTAADEVVVPLVAVGPSL